MRLFENTNIDFLGKRRKFYLVSLAVIILGIISQFSFVFLIVILLELILVIPIYSRLAPLISENFGLELSGQVNLSVALMELPFLYGLALFILVPSIAMPLVLFFRRCISILISSPSFSK